MPTYQFLYGYPKFYPAVQGADGRSLMANPGDVVDFDTPPSDGCWFPLPPRSDDPPAGPEPAAEPVVPEPEPAPAPVVPEPTEAVSPPVAEPPAEGPKPFMFPGFRFPSA